MCGSDACPLVLKELHVQIDEAKKLDVQMIEESERCSHSFFVHHDITNNGTCLLVRCKIRKDERRHASIVHGSQLPGGIAGCDVIRVKGLAAAIPSLDPLLDEISGRVDRIQIVSRVAGSDVQDGRKRIGLDHKSPMNLVCDLGLLRSRSRCRDNARSSQGIISNGGDAVVRSLVGIGHQFALLSCIGSHCGAMYEGSGKADQRVSADDSHWFVLDRMISREAR